MSSPIRGWGLVPGLLPPGARNLITDVPGVTVGHWTLQNARHNTGLTVIVPRPGIYDDPCTAACWGPSGIPSKEVSWAASAVTGRESAIQTASNMDKTLFFMLCSPFRQSVPASSKGRLPSGGQHILSYRSMHHVS